MRYSYAGGQLLNLTAAVSEWMSQLWGQMLKTCCRFPAPSIQWHSCNATCQGATGFCQNLQWIRFATRIPRAHFCGSFGSSFTRAFRTENSADRIFLTEKLNLLCRIFLTENLDLMGRIFLTVKFEHFWEPLKWNFSYWYRELVCTKRKSMSRRISTFSCSKLSGEWASANKDMISSINIKEVSTDRLKHLPKVNQTVPFTTHVKSGPLASDPKRPKVE